MVVVVSPEGDTTEACWQMLIWNYHAGLVLIENCDWVGQAVRRALRHLALDRQGLFR
jgi:hypothetical protein